MNVIFTDKPTNYRFDPMDRVFIQGTEARLQYANESGYVFSHTDGGGLSFNMDRDQMTRLVSMGQIRHDIGYHSVAKATMRLRSGGADSIGDLHGKSKNRLSKRSAFIESYKALIEEKKVNKTDKSIAYSMDAIAGRAIKYAKNLNPSGFDQLDKAENFSVHPSPRTLRRWYAAHMALDTFGLVDNMSLRGNRSSLMGSEASVLMWKHIRSFAVPDRPTIRLVHEQMSVEFGERNAERDDLGQPFLHIPSYETVRRAVHSMDAYEVYLMRHGREAARKKFRPALCGMLIDRPGQRIEMDEWTTDSSTISKMPMLMELMSPEERIAIGLDGQKARWVITVAIDVATRCILGLILSRNPKGSAAVRCLEMVTQNKGKWSDCAECFRDWDMHLTPETVVTDGGSAFISEKFRFACADLGITKEVATAGFPEMRGHIERMFGTIALSLMPMLSGRTYSNSVLKGSANPQKRAALTVDDLTFALTRWIVDIYHSKCHQGLDGESPVECWRRLTEQYGVNPPPDARRRRACFGNHLVRSLGKEGVTVLNVKYHSEQLARFMNKVGQGDVKVRWSPANVGSIDVLCGIDWFEVPSVNLDLRNTSAQVLLAAYRKSRVENPKTKTLNRTIIQGAISAISERNAAAIAASGIVLEDWNAERIAHEEDANMSSFQIMEGPASVTASDGTGLAGASIADALDDDDPCELANANAEDQKWEVS